MKYLKTAFLYCLLCGLIIFIVNYFQWDWEIREQYLLPDNCKLKQLSPTKMANITLYNHYSIIGNIISDSLYSYPKNDYGIYDVAEGRITKWHKPSSLEFKKLHFFFTSFSDECKSGYMGNLTKSTEILKLIENNNNYLIAFIFDKRHGFLSKNSYFNILNPKIPSKMEVYILNIEDKELIHILYGLR